MRHLRRIAVIAVQLLMIQFTIVSGAMACPSGGDMVHGMDPGASVSHTTEHHQGSPAHAHHCLHCESPCSSSGCSAGGQCSWAEIVADGTPSPASAAVSAERVALRTALPRSVSAAPEPPPPRL